LQSITDLEALIANTACNIQESHSSRTKRTYWHDTTDRTSTYEKPEAIVQKEALLARLGQLRSQMSQTADSAPPTLLQGSTTALDTPVPVLNGGGSVALPAAAVGDPSQAVLKDEAALAQAIQVWEQKALAVSKHSRTGVEVRFSAGSMGAGELHQRLQAMGVDILEDEHIQPDQKLPYGIPKGQRSQPAVEVTFAVEPKPAVITVQIHSRQRILAWKGKRGAFELNKNTILVFFGAPTAVLASAPAKEKAAAAAAAAPPNTPSVLDVWRDQQRGNKKAQ
jgi:hypothetical protein